MEIAELSELGTSQLSFHSSYTLMPTGLQKWSALSSEPIGGSLKKELHADATYWPLKSSVGLEQPALHGLNRVELRIRLAFGG